MGKPRPGEAIIHSIEIACKRLSVQALGVLEKALDEVKTPGLEYRYRIVAAKEILDRAWGKPKQAIEASLSEESTTKFLESIREARLRAAGVLPEEPKPLGDSDPREIH